MNHNSSANRAQHHMPSDDQMDSLLRDFFRREVPTNLDQPLRRNQAVPAPVATLERTPEHRLEQLRARSVRGIAVAASVAAMALAVLVVISGNHAPPSANSNVANGNSRPPDTTQNNDKAMLVSPEGDSRTSTKTVSPDGVTLEETDSIELHPQN